MINNHIFHRKVILKLLLSIMMTGFLATLLSAQSLTGIDPDNGMQGETLELTISGQSTHFLQATNVSVNLQQGTETMIFPQQVSYQNDETMYATLTFSYGYDPGFYDLQVTNNIDGIMMLDDAFEILENPVQPELVSIDPVSGMQGETLEVLISGQNTHFQASTTTVMLKQGTLTIYPQINQVLNDSQISSTFYFGYWHPTGLYDVYTNNFLDGELILENAFTLTEGLTPQVNAIDPPGGIAGTMLEFDIYGENTHFMDAATILAYLSRGTGFNINLEFDVITNTHLHGTIVLPYFNPYGYYNLTVTNNIDGTIVLEDAFFLEENTITPEVLYMEPDSAYSGDVIEVNAFTLNTWFDWAQTLNVYMKKSGSFQNIYHQGIQIVDNEQLKINFNIPSESVPGYYDLYITDNLDGQIIGSEVFYIIDTITGIHDPMPAENISVYPNPAADYINISSSSALSDCNITVFNYSGQNISLDKITFSPGVAIRVNFSDLIRGVYFVKIISNKKMVYKKLIKY